MNVFLTLCVIWIALTLLEVAITKHRRKIQHLYGYMLWHHPAAEAAFLLRSQGLSRGTIRWMIEHAAEFPPPVVHLNDPFGHFH